MCKQIFLPLVNSTHSTKHHNSTMWVWNHNFITSSSALVTCTEGCGCSDRYSPVCSSDGLTTFYSPCYAGCTTANTSASPVVRNVFLSGLRWVNKSKEKISGSIEHFAYSIQSVLDFVYKVDMWIATCKYLPHYKMASLTVWIFNTNPKRSRSLEFPSF